MRALEKNPDDRIPGCGEFVRLLEQVGKPSSSGREDVRVNDKWARIVIMAFLAVALLLIVWYANS
jgi:hypothetical protein